MGYLVSILIFSLLVFLADCSQKNHGSNQKNDISEQWKKLTKKQNVPEKTSDDIETADCIYYFKVEARTGTLYLASQYRRPYSNLAIELNNGIMYSAEIIQGKPAGSDVVRIIERSSMRPMLPEACITQSDIAGVYLQAPHGSNDGWYVKSINTYTADSTESYFTPLTSDPNFNKWVDFDNEFAYSYDATLIQLTKAVPPGKDCIRSIRIVAKTGNVPYAGFDRNDHKIVLQLSDSELQGFIPSPAYYNQEYSIEMDMNADFNSQGKCIRVFDINEVRLEAGGNDGWFITSIETQYITPGKRYQQLTKDPIFDRWIDGNGYYPYDATRQILSLGREHSPHCGYGIEVCECEASAEVCIFNLEIDEIRTFTSYQKFPVSAGDGIFLRGTQGVIYEIGDDGEVQYLEQYDGRHCANNFNSEECSDPQFVDGKTYRMAIGVNGQIPGPTLIAHYEQKLMIHVHNNLTSEGISIHWHGMHQNATPWMDGVGQVTQCQIGPSSSYSYIYEAKPAGTFWYHSHSGAQRTDGFYGVLAVKERSGRLTTIKQELNNFGVGDFEDIPGLHSISLLDWQHEASLDLFSQLNAGLGFHLDSPIGELPPNDKFSRYNSTRSYDEGEVGPMPYFSGLINGKGRHDSVPYNKTRLTVFPVETGKRYRFRLVGAQGLYAYKFSVDGHKLTVVNTDGYWIEPRTEVDFILIHTGERYDFILEANATFGNYWMRAETLEIDRSSNGGEAPFDTLNHVAEAILQYVDGDVNEAPEIHSTQYENIKINSPARVCDSTQMCKAINCPFLNFHESYYTNCVNVHQLRLLEPTPENDIPQAHAPADCPDCLHFINFNFEGDSETSAVNGRNFLLPPAPPQTQYEDFEEQSKICDLSADCNPTSLACSCTHVIDIPYMRTVQFVLTALGSYENAHPIHLHGHTFHVVHVGYPSYDPDTGFITRQSDDIFCDDLYCTAPGCDPKRCTRPHWNGTSPSFNIDSKTIRKDTVYVPAGGYVVINIISNNPGFWFLHCHIEVHQLEGMAVIINEAFEQQSELEIPEYFNQCGDVEMTLGDYSAQQNPSMQAFKVAKN